MKKISLFLTTIAVITLLAISCCKEDSCVENQKSDCACYELYAPVCGCNGKTYANDCVAVCAGITDYTDGACE